ncbi:ThuA domain-containing protein [Adhaeribacter aquaticus]|uniref:ThuA domain-containing protein n=1 Tax=Adhaeribacter aquaticus TaxID=299567 RepID=UPI000427A642|nr:ThuA domain-containing protein [Adhaeribacter aquaticus]
MFNLTTRSSLKEQFFRLSTPSFHKITHQLKAVLVAFVLVGFTVNGQLAIAQSKKIIFLAGPKDHGAPGRHEYEKDLRLLAQCLETSTNLKGVTTKVIVGKAPKDINELKDAAAIVILSSSDRDTRETHPLFPPQPSTDGRSYDAETQAYLNDLDKLVKTGVGVVVFHYANWVEHWKARGLFLDWTGGLWVQMASRNPNDDWTITLKNESHPVLRGVKPWTYKDEIFCRFFLPNDPKRTDLLLGTPAKSPVGQQVAAWAYQREDGGRGFVMGGVDYHSNMQIEDYRRFLLNGIAWAAKLEVPAKGIQSTIPKAQ